MDDPVKVMVVDLGSFSCKCAVVDRINSHIKTTTIESVVAMVSFIHYICSIMFYMKIICGAPKPVLISPKAFYTV